jgi:hypothetical protein
MWFFKKAGDDNATRHAFDEGADTQNDVDNIVHNGKGIREKLTIKIAGGTWLGQRGR